MQHSNAQVCGGTYCACIDTQSTQGVYVSVITIYTTILLQSCPPLPHTLTLQVNEGVGYGCAPIFPADGTDESVGIQLAHIHDHQTARLHLHCHVSVQPEQAAGPTGNDPAPRVQAGGGVDRSTSETQAPHYICLSGISTRGAWCKLYTVTCHWSCEGQPCMREQQRSQCSQAQ